MGSEHSMNRLLGVGAILVAVCSCAERSGPTTSSVTRQQVVKYGLEENDRIVLEVDNTARPVRDPVEVKFEAFDEYFVALRCVGTSGVPYVQATATRNRKRAGTSEPFPCAKSPVRKRFAGRDGDIINLAVSSNSSGGWELVVYVTATPTATR